MVIPVGPGPERVVVDNANGVASDKAFWMDDGVTLIFRGRDASGGRSVFTVPVAGGTPRKVAVVDNGIGAVRGGWAYAHGSIFLSVQEQQSDISVLEAEPR